ncbi:MAG: hypothetical protein ACE5MB_11360, partial [Anaerolineae bacterium]
METDELAELIRLSLRQYVADSHPSPQVWANIKAELTRPPKPFYVRLADRLASSVDAPRLLQSAVTVGLLIFIFSALLRQPLSPWGGGYQRQSGAGFSTTQDTLSMAYLARQHGGVPANRPLSSIARRADDDPFSSPRFERIRNRIYVVRRGMGQGALASPDVEDFLHGVYVIQEPERRDAHLPLRSEGINDSTNSQQGQEDIPYYLSRVEQVPSE